MYQPFSNICIKHSNIIQQLSLASVSIHYGTDLLTILLEEAQLEALVELHLLVLPEFVRVRVCRAHGGELRAHSPRRAAVKRGLATATARLRAHRFRCLQTLQDPLA